MKKVFPFLLGIILVAPLLALTSPAQNDPKATAILKKVSDKFKLYKSVKTNFTYQIINANGKSIDKKSGTVLMKGNKYNVTMSGMEVFSDGKSVYTFDKASNEVTITTIDETSNAITPQKLFTNFYDKDFLSMLNGTTKFAGKVVDEIMMTPIDKTLPYHKIYLLVDKSSTIVQTKLLEKTGNSYVYDISGFTPNAAIDDSKFVYNKSRFPGAEVVDLR